VRQSKRIYNHGGKKIQTTEHKHQEGEWLMAYRLFAKSSAFVLFTWKSGWKQKNPSAHAPLISVIQVQVQEAC
jgi:hypothetical protein